MTPHVCPTEALMLPWLGELKGASLTMTQANAPPVPAHVPMFRVPTVLRRVPSVVPPTRRRSSEHAKDVAQGPSFGFPCGFCGCHTQHHPLSASDAKSRARNAFWGPENVLRMFFNHL